MGFLDFLAGTVAGLSSIGNQIITLIIWLANAMVALFTFVWNVLVAVANFLYKILTNVARFFKLLWEKFFKGIFTKTFAALLKAHDWLEAHLGPVIKFLRGVRDFIDRIFNKYVKPFLNLIQHIRQVLLIFRLLHIKFAQQLDAALLKIELKVAGVFLDAKAVLNAQIDLLNILIDPARLLRHPVLIIALRRSIAAICRSVTGLPIGFFFPSRKAKRGSEFMSPFLDGGPALAAPGTMPAPLPVSDFLGDSSFLSADGAPLEDELAPEPDPLDYFTDAGAPIGSSGASITFHGVELLRAPKSRRPGEHDLAKLGAPAGDLFAALVS